MSICSSVVVYVIGVVTCVGCVFDYTWCHVVSDVKWGSFDGNFIYWFDRVVLKGFDSCLTER